jgi:hypothetical protein
VVLSPLLASIVLLVNTKFTGAIFAVLLVGGTFVVAALLAGIGLHRLWRGSLAFGGVILIAVVLLGFNPYVTNTLRHDGPLYPVLGPHSREIARPFVTPAIEGDPSVVRLLRSVVAESSIAARSPEPKLPLTFSRPEWSAFRGTGVRFGGFGPWFSAALVVSLAGIVALAVLGALGKVRLSCAGRTLLGAAGVCLVSVLVMPESFVARFAPQLWYVPAFVLLALLITGRPTGDGVPRVLGVIAWTGLAVLLVNALGVTGFALRWDVRDGNRHDASLARLRSAPGSYDVEFGVWRAAEARRLRDAGIDYREIPAVTCAQPLWLGIEGSLTPVNSVTIRRPVQGTMLCPTP